MSKPDSAIVVLLLTATFIGCNDSHHKEDASLALGQLEEQQDSLRQSNREAVVSARYPNALMWDSLNYQFTYAYQKAFQRQPIVIVDDYVVKDVWQSDSTLNILCTFDNIYFKLDCQMNDSLFIHKIVPNLMKRASDGGWTLEELTSYTDVKRSNPWIVIQVHNVSKINRIDNSSYFEDDNVKNNHDRYDMASNFSGSVLDIID